MARDGQAAWSAGGRELVFVSNRSGSWQLWRLDATTGEAVRLTQETGPVGGPRWDPDLTSIWFYAEVGGRYVLRRTDRAGAAPVTHPTPLRHAFRPAPHPTDELLLFDGVVADGDDHDIFLLELDSGRLRRLTSDPGYESDARWSPDGRWIAFHSDQGAGGHDVQVHVMRADGTERRQLTEAPALHGYPAWSPNGRCLTFTREQGDRRGIRIMDLTSNRQWDVGRPDGFYGEPAFHPLGARIVATARRDGVEHLISAALPTRVQEACG